MHPLTLTLAADHIRELTRAAEAERRAARGQEPRSSGPSRWRRSLGAGAEHLSLGLAELAIRLDPPGCAAAQGVRRYGAE